MKNLKTSSKLFSKDFLLVLIGQIISIFGNIAVRFALPLYLLNETGSPALFGTITACSFIPVIILSPVGGIIADRVNKRNIMVILDFSTAAITLIVSLFIGKVDVVGLVLTSLIILYGIQGAYQPAVQASVPLLLDKKHIMQGNAAINLISSLATFIGPTIGGTLYSSIGILPILYFSSVCFFCSAVMEIFIKIPFKKSEAKGNIFKIGFNDLKESFKYIKHDNPVIWQVAIIICLINLFLSALVMIGLPIIVTQSLGFKPNLANTLYGYAEGAVGAGSFIGGILAGVLSKKLKPRHSPLLLLLCILSLIPIGLVLNFMFSPMLSYVVILISCLIMMILSALFSIQVMSYLQILTPENMLGKVLSCAMCIGMCATPIGQAVYGVVFQVCKNALYIPFYLAVIILLIILLLSKSVFGKVDVIMENK